MSSNNVIHIMDDDDDDDDGVDVVATTTHEKQNENNEHNDLPAFLQEQNKILKHYQQQQRQQDITSNNSNNHQHHGEEDNEDTCTALAAAIAVSAKEQQEREERKRNREILERQQQEAADAAAAAAASRLQEDYELAKVIEESEQEIHVQETAELLEISLQQEKSKRQKERHIGCWDCIQCTYENPPYSPECIMCQSLPPSTALVFQNITTTVAAATATTTTGATNVTNTRFGIELELIITNGKRDGYTLNWIADEITKLGPPYLYFQGYTHETTHGQNWKLVTDGSIRGLHDHHDLCCELVSPVLQYSHDGGTPDSNKKHDDDGLQQIRILMEHIRSIGIAINKTCGYHIHVDATPNISILYNIHVLKCICQCFVALENAFDIIVSSSTSNNSNNHRKSDNNMFCRSNRIVFGTLSNKQRWDEIASVKNHEELVQLINPNNGRYRKLNLTNIINPNRPSTLEWRLHGGVIEIQEAEVWIRFILRFCHHCAIGATTTITNKNNENNNTTNDTIDKIKNAICTIQNLSEDTTPAQELQVLWTLIDDTGIEQYYTMQRKLYEEKQLQSIWRCCKCRKPFKTSRDLAQHVNATGHS